MMPAYRYGNQDVSTDNRRLRTKDRVSPIHPRASQHEESILGHELVARMTPLEACEMDTRRLMHTRLHERAREGHLRSRRVVIGVLLMACLSSIQIDLCQGLLSTAPWEGRCMGRKHAVVGCTRPRYGDTIGQILGDGCAMRKGMVFFCGARDQKQWIGPHLNLYPQQLMGDDRRFRHGPNRDTNRDSNYGVLWAAKGKQNEGDPGDDKTDRFSWASSLSRKVFQPGTDESGENPKKGRRKKSKIRRSADDESSEGNVFSRVKKIFSKDGDEEVGVPEENMGDTKKAKDEKVFADAFEKLTSGKLIDIPSSLSLEDKKRLELLREANQRKRKAQAEALKEQRRMQREEAQKRAELKRLQAQAAAMESEQRKEREKLRLERQRTIKEVVGKGKSGMQVNSSGGDTALAGGNETKANPVQNFFVGLWDTVKRDKEAEWIVVCPKTQIAPGQALPVQAGGIDLLVVASKDANRLYCVANSCPHLGTPMETGVIEQRRVPESVALKAKPPPPPTTVAFPTMGIPAGSVGDGSDRCEDCIVCPMHQTAFALDSGEVRGEWCPYPPVIGNIIGAVKPRSNLPTFSVRIKGKNIEVRINSSLGLDKEKGKRGTKRKQ